MYSPVFGLCFCVIIFSSISVRVRENNPTSEVEESDEKSSQRIFLTEQHPLDFNGFLNDGMHDECGVVEHCDHL